MQALSSESKMKKQKNTSDCATENWKLGRVIREDSKLENEANATFPGSLAQKKNITHCLFILHILRFSE